jgi:hypothetical protein
VTTLFVTLREVMHRPTTTGETGPMKLLFDLKPQRAPLIAWVTILLANASYLALVLQFELKSILLTLFVGATIAVIAYWLPAETACLFDDEVTADDVSEESD